MKYRQPFDQPNSPDASYQNASPSLGIRGSILDIIAVEQVQREILKVVTQAGLTPSDTDLTQLYQAISSISQTIINSTINNVILNQSFSANIPYAVAGGTAAALTAHFTPAISAYSDGRVVLVKLGAAGNPAGAVTLEAFNASNVSLGVHGIIRDDGSALQANDLPANGMAILAYDATRMSWLLIAALTGAPNQTAGWLQNVIVATASGNYVKSARAKRVRVRGWGPGGAAGACSTNGNLPSAGGGGGAGGYFEKLYDAATLAASEAFTIGAPGLGQANTTIPGGDGGSTTFKLCTALGGKGGSTFYLNGAVPGGQGGTATGGDINLPGADGSFGSYQSLSGVGGGAPFGGPASITPNQSVHKGKNGYAPGGGGAGITSTVIGDAGGDGATGMLIFEEYGDL